ncbi:MAG: hypothetical protein LBV69_06260 [Bacteroidales bacterium]|nr:hypothetical protein [Bacteroidales bacterium]
MKKILNILIFMFAFVMFFTVTNAQIRIGGNTAPNSSAILDLNPDNSDNSQMGLLLPRVQLVSSDNASPMNAHIKGMFVYNTININDVIIGIYYNDGQRWINLSNNSEEQQTHVLSIHFGQQIDVISMSIKGKFTNQFPLENIISIMPIFSEDNQMLELLNTNTSYFIDENGLINWTLNIVNKNSDINKSIMINEIVITYKGNSSLSSNTPLVYEYVGW